MKLKIKLVGNILKVVAKRIKQAERDIPDFFRNHAGPMIRDGLMETFLESANKWRPWSPMWQRMRAEMYGRGSKRRINKSTSRKVKFPPGQPEFIGRLTGAMFTALTAKRSAMGSFRKYNARRGKARVMMWGVRTDSSAGIPYAPTFHRTRPIRIYTPIGDSMRRAARSWLIRKVAGRSTVKI